MQYGYFDDSRREYVITTPATPLPWINYLGSKDFLGMISNTGGGYCFYRDAKLQRILRYRYNSVPGDNGGRIYYLKEAGKDAWNPGFLPTRTKLDRYECRHGMGYTTFNAAKDGLAAKMTFFVPVDDNCEIHDLVLTNETAESKTVHIWGVMEWCLWNAVDDANNYQRNLNIAESEVEDGIIYHKTEYRERRDHYAFYGVNVPACGWDTDRNTFLGHMGEWRDPQLVREQRSAFSKITGWYPIGCHHLEVKLAPGESYRAVFTLGYGRNPRDQKFIAPGIIRKDTAKLVCGKYADPAAVDAAMAELAAYWDKLLGNYRLCFRDEKLTRMVNIWHQYQCMVTFNLSRSASYYETGTGRGMGFRDSCQDLYGFMHIVPDRARERIIDIASIQFADGSTYHQYQPLTKRGNNDIGGGFNDDPLWLVGAVCAYIKETGDFTILDHPTPFDNVPGTEVPLLEHVRRSVNFTINNRGPHGLPLIGRADWNDCLNLNCFSEEPGESFQTFGPSEGPVAESVFIGGMFVKYGRDYAELCDRIGLTEEADSIRCAVTDVEKAILCHGWDGQWFLRAYDAFGAKIGASECEEGKIFIEPQGFCTMAGVGGKEYGLKAMESTRKYLLGEYGVELLYPCYTKYHLELGEISSYPPGFKENGAVFCHNNPWIVCAESALGRGNEAFDIYRRICPAYLEDKSEIHETEPYCYSQMVTGRGSGNPGHAKNSWLTGTASWTFLSISQAILGIYPEYDGLRIQPCIPDDWDEFTVIRRFRGTEYTVHVKRTGETSIRADGTVLHGNVVPLTDRDKVFVEVTLMSTFPKDFLWGAASSAYQIEGCSLEDGGGASIWHTFSHTPGKIANDDHGDIACDSYHRYEEDIALLKELGVKAYRFSTSWARIDPSGDGNWNMAGVAYYDKLVNACLANGIEPYMTLYHWELPQAVEDRGGWRSGETADAFGRFAAFMANHFKDRVKNYFTLNEPQCTTSMGYAQGLHAPGLKLPLEDQFRIHVHQMIAHGLAQRAIKEADPTANVGLASTGNLCYPETETAENIEAARQATFGTSMDFWIFTHQWLLDPVCLGQFPDCAGTPLEPLVKTVTAEQMQIIHTVPDMLGFNVYNGHAIRAAENGFKYVAKYPGFPRTALKWPVTPEVLDWGMRFVYERYQLPVYITENGLSCNDKIYLDGKVHDPDRIDFLARYLLCLNRAVENGADVRGYFHWALTDNFEWHSGYADRFGLVFVDYPAVKRIPKDSFHWYREVVRTGIVTF